MAGLVPGGRIVARSCPVSGAFDWERLPMQLVVGKAEMERWAAEKQASRDRDQRRPDAGEITVAELAEENNFFKGFNLEEFRIESIGGRTLRRR
jgi:hypothetical protein